MSTNDRSTAVPPPHRYPSYHPRDYPVGLDDFVNTFPPHRRQEVRTAVFHAHVQWVEQRAWVDRQMQAMLELPDIVYKYVPYQRLDDGSPTTLRATQPGSLNDVMEGNISTSMQGKMDRDEWYALIARSLREIFREDTIPDEELERRKRVYGDPMVSTIIRDYLSQSVGVVSFSGDPLIPTMWAHYARNSGFVVGYNTNALRDFGMDFRRILYLELAPVYMPTRDSIIRIRFVDEERRQHKTETENKPSGTPLLGHDVEFVELKKDLDELVKLLFVKGQAWSYEQEIRLLVDLNRTTRLQSTDDCGFPIHVFEVPAEAIEEVYVGFDTPTEQIRRIQQVVAVGEGRWRLKYTHWHAYRLQVTSTSISNRKQPSPPEQGAHPS